LNQLSETFAACKARGEGVFMPFLVIGDPDLATSMKLTEALVDAGADMLEFGFPFSDPPADGPVIQAADQRALSQGVTPDDCFDYLDEVNRRFDKPVALLLYYNLVLNRGVEAFMARARQAGVDAVLVADVPVEEGDALSAAARAEGIAPVFIASELTSADRLRQVRKLADGYLYVVARVGITGEQAELDGALAPTLQRLRSQAGLPLLVGFGLSRPEHVRAVISAGADGAICGSALIRRIEANLGDADAMIREVGELAGELKEATRG